MIHPALLEPRSIAIIGASNDLSKPGGRVLHNIISHGYEGQLYGVNPKEHQVQGVACFPDVTALPQADCAIIAIAAPFVVPAMEVLAFQKNCKAFILFTAGFSETGEPGRALEDRCVQIANEAGATLIGP
ncbi:MAG TPA: CoA-binding protein, partial [Flavisolibacter sp.]